LLPLMKRLSSDHASDAAGAAALRTVTVEE